MKIRGQNESILQNEVVLKERYPEYADMDILINQANKCKSVTSLGKFVAKHDVALEIVGVLSLMAGVAFCASGCFAAGIPLLIMGILACGLSTDKGWETCEKVSSKFNNPDIAQPAQAAGQSVK